ncbi:type VII toxin-antitoxin system HepT family RNase toxin [Caldicellulosiruptor acetigenus]|uniref:DUF86 domain-containing protein n=1 Tax=Caldicellulosiruptor acetigenus 6A TaxID=632516 RepID=G2PUZ5_9FIRM|nr:DUF86 domain-containing protein [Caldicellulosiruptor acetigenus]AEM74547.1 protein of unknown function DUF86 [Caldicellulosiruptor acetigenus 6A]
MDEKILFHLKFLKKYIELLNEISKVDFEEYMKSEILKGAAQRYLQVAIETCINIGNRIISIEQTKGKNIKAPETYADIFLTLAQLDIINDEFSRKLSQMAKFRNKLVHLYWEIDDNLVYKFLKENLKDFEEYLCCIKKYIQND